MMTESTQQAVEAAAPLEPLQPPSKAVVGAALLAFPLLCLLLGGVLLPRPAGIREARNQVDRKALRGIVLKKMPQVSQVLKARLGGIQILGADFPSSPLKVGSPLLVAFYFQAAAEIDQNWKIFLHIDRKGATYRIHGDHEPAQGRYLTSMWQKGDIVKDSHRLSIPADAPPGEYDVWLGFYIGDERLPWKGGDSSLHDGKNRVRMGTIILSK